MKLWLALGLVLVRQLWPAEPDGWPRFRGPNGAGLVKASGLPAELSPSVNLKWKRPIPAGHSSPVASGNRVFLTAFEEKGSLLTLCLDLRTGRELWRASLPRERSAKMVNPYNGPATPTPAVDGNSVFVFFQDFGLVSYSLEGEEQWRLPLGPWRNNHGMGASPIVWRDLLILPCDQDVGSFLLAVDKRTGREGWRIDRKEIAGVSYSTPTVSEVPGKPPLLIVPGSFQLAAYRLDDRTKQWWVNGLPYSPRAVPVLGRLAGGEDVAFLNVQTAVDGAGLSMPPFQELADKYDRDADRRLSTAEVREYSFLAYGFAQVDIDGDGYVTEKEWRFRLEVFQIPNLLMAVRLDGQGDVTKSHVVWQYRRSLPNVPSPILYEGILYLLKEGGIFTAMNPGTGEIFKQGRLPGALEPYFASPVAADGKLFLLSQHGKIAVVLAGRDWEVLSVGDLGEDAFATPAIVDRGLLIRTRGSLWRFEKMN